MRFAPALPLVAILGALAFGASAQAVLDVGSLRELGDAEVVTADGTEVGEIDEVVIDPAGNVVAIVVDLDGFLGIGDENIVFALSDLTYEEVHFVTALGDEKIEDLPRYDD